MIDAAVRREFPVLKQTAYLNTGTFGPTPRSAMAAMTESAEDELTAGRSRLGFHNDTFALRDRIRESLGRLIGGAADEMALTRATTEGTNLLAAALRLGPGDEIITTAEEHHAFRTALYTTGAKVIEVSLAGLTADEVLNRLSDAITPATRLIALSHVLWTSGQILPAAEISRLGPPVLLDGAQSVGAIEVDVAELGCQYLAFPGQKWLLGPDATGGLYVRRDCQDALKIAMPSTYGHHVPPKGDDIPREGATRFDPGPIARPMLRAWLAGLDFAEGVGPERFAHAQALAGKFRAAMSAREEVIDHPDPATLVSFVPRGEPDSVNAALEAAGVRVRTLPSTGWIRASVGWWNDESDLERLLGALG